MERVFTLFVIPIPYNYCIMAQSSIAVEARIQKIMLMMADQGSRFNITFFFFFFFFLFFFFLSPQRNKTWLNINYITVQNNICCIC